MDFYKTKHQVKPMLLKQKPLSAREKKFLKSDRCCLREHQQLEYVDYDLSNLYGPVSSHDAIGLLLSTLASDNLMLEEADVSNDYFHSYIDIPSLIHRLPDDWTR